MKGTEGRAGDRRPCHDTDGEGHHRHCERGGGGTCCHAPLRCSGCWSRPRSSAAPGIGRGWRAAGRPAPPRGSCRTPQTAGPSCNAGWPGGARTCPQVGTGRGAEGRWPPQKGQDMQAQPSNPLPHTTWGGSSSAGMYPPKILAVHPVLHPPVFPPSFPIPPPPFSPVFPGFPPGLSPFFLAFCPFLSTPRFPPFSPVCPPFSPVFPIFPVVYDVPAGIPDLAISRPCSSSCPVGQLLFHCHFNSISMTAPPVHRQRRRMSCGFPAPR